MLEPDRGSGWVRESDVRIDDANMYEHVYHCVRRRMDLI